MATSGNPPTLSRQEQPGDRLTVSQIGPLGALTDDGVQIASPRGDKNDDKETPSQIGPLLDEIVRVRLS